MTPEGLAIDGAMPFEVQTRVDGFATPLFHRDGRSALTWWGSTLEIEYAPGVQWGNGVAQLVTTTTWPRPWFALPVTLTTADAQIALNAAGRRAVLRAWWADRFAVPSFDGQASALVYATHRLAIRTTAIALLDTDDDHDDLGHPVASHRDATRVTFEELYRPRGWTASFAQSILFANEREERGAVQHHRDARTSFDTRNELRRTLRDVAGLAKLDLAFGAEADATRHALDIADAADPHENVPATGIVAIDETSHRFAGTVWTSDVGAWTSATAQLAANVRATTELRAEAFGTDVSLQPRGSLEVALADRLDAALAAGAYRRAPDHADELEHPELHPERTSRVALALQRTADWRGRGAFGAIGVYYLDRTNLVTDDGTGKLANTGRGTTYGATASAGLLVDHWFALAAIVVERSERQPTPTTPLRTFEYDQPVRFDVRVTRFLGPWQLGAHWSLREGLPYTRVAGAHYDADRDVYLPDFARLYAERLPWQHQLDLRIDRAIGSRLRAYLDVANAYDARPAIGWDYNFNFTVRRAIAAPSIAPTLGIRGEL